MFRYTFHYERWHNHQRSLDICLKQKEGISQKVQILHDVKNNPSLDLEFFEQCADQVIQCRYVLKWSYVVGFFANEYLK